MKPELSVIEGTAPGVGSQRTRRLREIGAQTARVAHELKVPLSLIDGSLQSLEQYATAAKEYIGVTASRALDMDRVAALQADLDLAHLAEHAPMLFTICREGTRRLHLLIEQLEDYARDGRITAAESLVDLGPLLRQAIPMASWGRACLPSVESDLATESWVYGDAHALSRVFINLIGNAFDAVTETEQPRVVVNMTSGAVRSLTDAAVEIRIADNGPGVSPALRARIFEPFFTTKSRRSGLGLGLAIAKDIVEQHGGTIALAAGQDTPGRRISGAEFIVRLPAAQVSPA